MQQHKHWDHLSKSHDDEALYIFTRLLERRS